MCMCVHLRVCTQSSHVCVYTFTYMDTAVVCGYILYTHRVHVCGCVYFRIDTHGYVCISVYSHRVHVCVYIFTYIHTEFPCVCVCTHVYVHGVYILVCIYLRICTQSFGSFPRKNADRLKKDRTRPDRPARRCTAAVFYPAWRTTGLHHKKGQPSAATSHEARPGKPFFASPASARAILVGVKQITRNYRASQALGITS